MPIFSHQYLSLIKYEIIGHPKKEKVSIEIKNFSIQNGVVACCWISLLTK